MKTRFFTLIALLFVTASIQAQTSLYGLTSMGGVNNNGTIVKMNMDGTGFTKVYDFIDSIGSTPVGNMLQAKNGKLYGVCETGGQTGSCVIFSFDASTGDYEEVFDFGANTGDVPESGLVEDANGYLYGVASEGGVNLAGVIYSFNPATNKYADVYGFGSYYDINGSDPMGTCYLPAMENFMAWP